MKTVTCVSCGVQVYDPLGAPSFGYWCPATVCQANRRTMAHLVRECQDYPEKLKGMVRKAGLTISGKNMAKFKAMCRGPRWVLKQLQGKNE